MNAPQDRLITRLETAVSIALALLFIFSTSFFISRLWHPVSVDTNLKSLSPALSSDPQLRSAIDWLSSAMEQRFVLLLEANDEDKLFDIGEEFSDELAQLSTIQPQQQDALTQLLPVFASHPFNFLSPQDRQGLQSASLNQQLSQASTDLYRLPVAARLFPLTQDPFNLLSNYILDLGERVSGGKFNEEGIIVKQTAGKHVYYLPLVYRIPQGSLSMEVQQELVNTLNDIESRLFAPDPAINLYRSGIVFYAAEAASQSKRDISIISIGSSLGVLILLLLAFPSVLTQIIPIFSIIFGIAFAFAATHSLFSSIHILTIVFGASLIGIVIDYAIHYFFHWPSMPVANKRRMVYRALGLSLITSSIGYGALGISDLLSLKQIALFSCFGLFAAWVCIIALSRKFLPANFQPKTQRFLAVLRSAAPVIKPLNRLPSSIIFAVLLGIFLAIFVQGLKTNDNPRTLFNPSLELLRQDQKVSEIINDYEPGKYIVIRAKQEEELFQQLALLHQKTADWPLMSVLQWLPAPETQQANHALQQAIYQKGGFIEGFYSDIGIAVEKQQQIQQDYVQQQGKSLSIATLFKQAGNSIPPLWTKIDGQHYAFALIPKGTDFAKLQQNVQPLQNIHYIDTLHNATTALKDQRVAASGMLLAAFVIIACVLLLRYGQLSCLRMLGVPLCSCFVVIIFLSAMGIGITLFHSVALFLVLGLGMDYVIFSRESETGDPATMAAILVSTITSLLSFGLLATSSLTVVSAIGSTVLIGNLCNFVAVLTAFFKNNTTFKNNSTNNE